MLTKISVLNVGLIGLMVALNIGVAIFFMVIRPTQARLTILDGEIQKYSTRAAERGRMEADLEAAKEDQQKQRQDWAMAMASLMPDLDLTDRIKALPTFWREPERTQRVLEQFLEEQTRRNQIVSVSHSFGFAAPGTDPNALPWPEWQVDFGQQQIRGSFKQILDHIRRWNQAPRLVIVDGLSLNGTSPQINASYSARMLLIPRAMDDTPGGNVSFTAGASARGGTMGAMAPSPGMGGATTMPGGGGSFAMPGPGGAMIGAPGATGGAGGGGGARPPRMAPMQQR